MFCRPESLAVAWRLHRSGPSARARASLRAQLRPSCALRADACSGFGHVSAARERLNEKSLDGEAPRASESAHRGSRPGPSNVLPARSLASVRSRRGTAHRQRRRASGRRDYNYFRDYEPGTGRYVESDPIGLFGGLATYGYALSNPMQVSDPMGLRGTPIFPGPEACEYYDQLCYRTCDMDSYACSAGACCRAFGDNFSSNCTRKCLLVADEGSCQYLDGRARSQCRKRAHLFCYFNCVNVLDAVSGGFGLRPPPACKPAAVAIGGMWSGLF